MERFLWRMRQKITPLLLLLTALSTPLAGQVPASTPRTKATLPEVVVTATRSAADPFDVPYVAGLLSAERLRMVRTIPEAMRETPAVMVQKTAYGQGSPFIRGFTGYRTLMLIDGIRLNNSTFREGPNQYWNTIDPFSLERLELLKGPASVLYGSDAIGGTVNAFTLGTPENFTGRTYYRFASAEDSHSGRAEFGGAEGRLQLRGGFSLKSYGDLNNQPKTGYDEYDFDLKTSYQLTENSQLIAAWQHVDQNDAWRTHRTIYGRSFRGTTVGSDLRLSLDQKRDLAYLQYHAENLSEAVESLQLSASYHFQGESSDRIRSNFLREMATVDVQTLGLWGQLVSPTALGAWTYGAEYYRDWVDSGQSTYNKDSSLREIAIQGPVADDSTYDLFGLYAQNQIELPSRWELTLGGRYTYASADANRVRNPRTGQLTSLSDNWQSLVGNARLAWQLDEADHWRLFGGVSQGFRAPNLSDLTRFDTARSGELETAAPGLDPENFVSFESGVKTRYGQLRAELAYFYTLIDDMIIRQPTGETLNGSPVVTKRNSGEGYLHGIEASARWQFHPQVSLFGWITWMDGELDAFPTSAQVMRREPISRLMPLTGELGVRWDHPKKTFWAEALSLMADRQDALNSADRADTQRIPPDGTPGYTVLTVRCGWQVNEHFAVSAACENLLDQEYRIHGSGINEPERNFVVAGDLRF